MLFHSGATGSLQLYTLSLHDALPILLHPADTSYQDVEWRAVNDAGIDSNIAIVEADGLQAKVKALGDGSFRKIGRAHVELQSRENLVCRLLLEKKKQHYNDQHFQ